MGVIFAKQLSYSWIEQTLTILVNLVFDFVVGWFIYKYYKYRNIQSIKVRSPQLMIGMVLISLFNITMEIIPGILNPLFYCIPDMRWLIWVQQTFTAAAFVFPSIRCLYLIVRSETQKILLESIEKSKTNNIRPEEKSVVRYFLRGIPLKILTGLLYFIIFIPALSENLGFKVEPNKSRNPEYKKEYCQLYDPVTSGICFICTLLWLIFSFKIKQIEERFNVTRELKMGGILAMTHLLFIIPFGIYNDYFNGSIAYHIYLIILISIQTYILMIYPVKNLEKEEAKKQQIKLQQTPIISGFKSKDNPPPLDLTSKITIDSKIEVSKKSDKRYTKHEIEEIRFSKIFDKGNEELFDQFKNFLIKEFSLENLDFFLQVDIYKQEITDQNKITKFDEIFNKYIPDTSQTQINLPGKIFKKIIEMHKNKNNASLEDLKNIYDDAQTEMFSLMENDSYTRFCKDIISKSPNGIRVFVAIRNDSLTRSPGICPVDDVKK